MDAVVRCAVGLRCRLQGLYNQKVSHGDPFFYHLAHEYDNPLEKLPRVWQAYRVVKRHPQGPTERKHPIIPEMCDWIDAYQRTLGAAAAPASVIKRAARYIAIYLGCRCSEHLWPDIHWEKIILVSYVRPR